MVNVIKHQSGDLNFISLWSFLAQQIGSSRLPINQKASNLKSLFQKDNQCPHFIKTIILLSYQRGDCHQLDSPINIEIVLDILGETAYQLRQHSQDDLLNIELLEEIAWHIIEKYGHLLSIKSKPAKAKKAHIISFPQYKIKLANLRL